MYHCRINFYFFRLTESLVNALKEITPFEHFDHDFTESTGMDAALTADADVIIADLGGIDAKEAVKALLSNKRKDADLILLADKDQIETLMTQDLSEVADIWALPLTKEEMVFHFLKWMKKCKQEKELWRANNYLNTTINGVPHLVWYKDKNGVHTKVNNSFCKAVNKTMEQIEGRGHYYIWDIHPDEYAKGEFICMESEYEVMEKGKTCEFDETVKIGDEMRQFKTYKSPLFDLDGSIMGTVGVATDVTQERIYERMIINNANTDFLTGLYNRRYAYQFIEQEEYNSLTVFYLDLDNFKSVNDRYGHQEGDRALIVTTEVLKKCMPKDMIARVGGDEFLVAVIGDYTEQEIEEKRKWLQEQLDATFAGDEHLKGISASIGTAHSTNGEVVMDALIGEADTFMYKEKNKKKNASK